jgi:hypothetical protein
VSANQTKGFRSDQQGHVTPGRNKPRPLKFDGPPIEQLQADKKQPRNAPCACGSGKKAKRCCGDKVCAHPRIPKVEFDVEAASGLPPEEIRERWPRFFGPCPDCKATVIAYASQEHYIFGDW